MAPKTQHDLEDAEEQLTILAAHLEAVAGPTDYHRAVLALGHRARSLFIGFRYLLDSPAPAAALSLVRPMVEVNLVLRFLSRNPMLHTELWVAEGDRHIVAEFTEYEQDAYLRARWGPLPAERLTLLAEMRDHVKKARAKAREAGLEWVAESGSLIPTVKEMARAEPAAREAYTLAYRATSADVHVGSWSFRKGTFVPRVGGLTSYHDGLEPEDAIGTRTLALTTFASTLRIASLVLGLGIEHRADEIKQGFVLEEPPADQ